MKVEFPCFNANKLFYNRRTWVEYGWFGGPQKFVFMVEDDVGNHIYQDADQQDIKLWNLYKKLSQI